MMSCAACLHHRHQSMIRMRRRRVRMRMRMCEPPAAAAPRSLVTSWLTKSSYHAMVGKALTCASHG